MGKRHEKLGIKQVIRLEWMDHVLNMLLAGMEPELIRAELKTYLADKKQSGGTGERGEKTYLMAIGPRFCLGLILNQNWLIFGIMRS